LELNARTLIILKSSSWVQGARFSCRGAAMFPELRREDCIIDPEYRVFLQFPHRLAASASSQTLQQYLLSASHSGDVRGLFCAEDWNQITFMHDGNTKKFVAGIHGHSFFTASI